MLRIPIPPLFFYEIGGRLEVVDGSQRIRTLAEFISNAWPLEGLEKLDILNSCHFSELPRAAARRLLNTPVRTFVLEETTDSDTRVELFRRLNTSAKSLTEAEIRKGAYRGRFLDLVLECADRQMFVELAPGGGARGNPDAASERQELVTRFFIYLDYRDEFRHDVRKFLDGHFKKLNAELGPQEINQKSDEFDRVMQFIARYMPLAFFRPSRTKDRPIKQVPRVRFEAIAVGTALALRENPDLVASDLSWLESAEFNELIRTDASNSGPKLRARIDYVRTELLRRS